MENYPLATERERSLKERYKDCLQKTFTACHVDPLCWSDMAADCDASRHLTFKAVSGLKKTEEIHKKIIEAKGKFESPQAAHRLLPLPVPSSLLSSTNVYLLCFFYLFFPTHLITCPETLSSDFSFKYGTPMSINFITFSSNHLLFSSFSNLIFLLSIHIFLLIFLIFFSPICSATSAC